MNKEEKFIKRRALDLARAHLGKIIEDARLARARDPEGTLDINRVCGAIGVDELTYFITLMQSELEERGVEFDSNMLLQLVLDSHLKMLARKYYDELKEMSDGID